MVKGLEPFDQFFGTVSARILTVPLNPFVWDRPLDDLAKIVGMDEFASETAMTLKAQTNVALFGPRGTGKTTFTIKLTDELQKSDGDDIPPFTVIRVDLQRAFSIAAFIACVHDGMVRHPEARVREQVRKQLSLLEKEIGFDFKLIKGGAKWGASGDAPSPSEVLHAQLLSLTRLSEHVVVIFDEFQRLRVCPDKPLAIIRSALMTGAGDVSLVFTGSIRQALKLMLDNADEPIFQQAVQRELPQIDRAQFHSYLDLNFQATERPMREEAIGHLLDISRCHPKRTQHLAWQVWRSQSSGPLDVNDVDAALDDLLDAENEAFNSMDVSFAEGALADAHEHKVLYMLADIGPSMGLKEIGRYGLQSKGTVTNARNRLKGKGLVTQRAGRWEIVDPLFAEWLRRKSPFAFRASSD
jgi:hypothetical protein